jgi:Na+-driven multidrug efflux pump
VGTILAAGLSTLFGYIYLVRKNRFLNIRNWEFIVHSDIIKKLFFVGAPVAAHMMIRSLSWIAIVRLVNSFGAELTAAYGIGVRIDMFAFLPALSLGMAVSSMVAQNLGAQRFDRIKQALGYAITLSLGISVFFYILVNAVPSKLASIFTSNPIVIANTIGYLRIVSFTYLLYSFIFSFHGIIKGVGDTYYLLIFIIISMVLVRIPAAYFLANHTRLSESGIWLGILSSSLVGAGLGLGYYLSGRWRKKPIV